MMSSNRMGGLVAPKQNDARINVYELLIKGQLTLRGSRQGTGVGIGDSA